MIIITTLYPWKPRFPWFENQPSLACQVKDGGFALGNFAATSTGHIEVWLHLASHRGPSGEWRER